MEVINQLVSNEDGSIDLITDSTDNPFSAAVLGNQEFYKMHEQLLARDLILAHSRGHQHHYVPRKLVEVDQFGYARYRGLVFKLDPASLSNVQPRNLVVDFGGTGVYDEMVQSDYWSRYGTDSFDGVPRNTIILRIIDFNLNVGSFFMNTQNYSTFENDVITLILQTIKRFNISMDHIVLYGSSKGGFAAQYYGLKNHWKFVANDPLIDISNYPLMPLLIGTQDFIDSNRIEVINGLSQPFTKIDFSYVIGNRYADETWPTLKKISSKFKVIDLNDPQLIYHPEVVEGSQSEARTLVSYLLLKDEL